MYRKIIADGDLMLMSKPWYGFFSDSWIPHRNLSEEARLLKDHVDKAMSKYKELSHLYAIAKKNVGDDLETLQVLLLENSEAYFETTVDNSILEQREGVKYNFRSDNNKKDSSSNKDNSRGNGNNNNNGNSKGKSNAKTKSLLSILSEAKVTLH